MKKLLLVLGITACLQLTACGTEATDANDANVQAAAITDEQALSVANEIIGWLDMVVAADAIAQIPEGTEDARALAGWVSLLEEMGSYQGIISVEAETVENEVTLLIKVDGSLRDATVQFSIDQMGALSNSSFTIDQTFGELMTKASLNTVLGMGTTFAILILISVVISCLSLIPKLQAKRAGKSGQEEAQNRSMDQTIAQIIEKEELADDRELVAVIAAAIAASQGSASTEGFRVRSIRKINTSKWKQA